MRDPTTRGLTLRNNIWWLNINRRIGNRQITLRESTGCPAHDRAGAIRVRDQRLQEETGRAHHPPTLTYEGRTFADAAAEYIADLERRGKDPARALLDIRPLLDSIGLLPLDHVHQRTLQPWIDAQRGRIRSGTVARALRTVSAILRFAAQVLRDGHIPWLTTAPPKLRAPDWGDVRQPRPLTWSEQDALVAVLPAHLVAPVLWSLYTGARQAEVCTLRWDQHRPTDGLPPWTCWWIPPEVRKASARARVSEREGRIIVCNRAARAVLDGQRGQDPDWVFPSPAGGRLFRINNHGWRTACAAVDLDIREHDLRHTWGHRAADAGIPLDMRRALLGHRRGGITEHYSRPGLARLLEEAERVTRPEGALTLVRRA